MLHRQLHLVVFLWYKLVHFRKHWFRWKNQLVVKKLSIQLILNSYWIRLWPNQKYKNRNTVTQKCSIQKLRRFCVFSLVRSPKFGLIDWFMLLRFLIGYILTLSGWPKNAIRSESIWNSTLFDEWRHNYWYEKNIF